MKRRRRALALLALVGLLAPLAVAQAGCKHDIDRRRVFVHNEGAVCLGPSVDLDAAAPQGVDLAPNIPLAIGVRSQVLSDMCATSRTSSCSVKRDGDRLIVKSELSWLGPAELDVKCRGATSVLEARCATDPLPPGSYHVVVGERTVDVSLPSHLDKSCVGVLESAKDVVPPPTSVPVADAAPPPGATGVAIRLDPNVVPAAPGTGVAPQPPLGDTLCIAPGVPSKDRSLKAGKPVAITILHKNLCLGASCTSATAKCTTKRKGSRIVLDVKFPTSTTKPTHPCSEDCTAIAVTCKTDALPASLYTIELADQRKALQIPAASPPPCGP